MSKTIESIIGKKARFTYPWYGIPDGYPQYTAHSGQTVKILRELTEKECDRENRPMLEVQAKDGWKGTVCRDELRVIRKKPKKKSGKKKLMFLAHFDIDFDAERKRLKKCFKGRQLQRQMHLVNLFEAGKIMEWSVAKARLPECPRGEHSEAEFIGLVFWDIERSLAFSKFTIDRTEVVDA